VPREFAPILAPRTPNEYPIPDLDRLTRNGPKPIDFLKYQPIALRFFHKTGANYKHCLDNRRNVTISHSDVTKCPSCGAEIQAGHPYCSACGKAPKISSGPSYQATAILAFAGLLLILCYGLAAMVNNQPVNPTAPPKPAPDEASELIARCGKPNRDVTSPAKLPSVPERRWLFYKSKNITATFDRAQQGTATWNDVRYFDHVSKRKLNQQQVAKRLPCALTTSQAATTGNRK